MFELLRDHYDNVTYDAFHHDLSEKDWVILLSREADGELVGFSTQMLMEHVVEGKTVMVVFSGDTIIDRQHWGGLALPVAWSRLMTSIRAEYPSRELYWFLISKGYKTYRFLPVFFHRFYPSLHGPPPRFEAQLMRSLAEHKFPGAYDPARGIVRLDPGAPRLKSDVAPVTAARLMNPHVSFFVQANPGHVDGDELVCLARFDEENLKPFLVRAIRKWESPILGNDPVRARAATAAA